jgi:primase-polymerase (primpol)-like protein
MTELTDFIAAKQWVAWRLESRSGDDVTKVPYMSAAHRAESDNPSTWLTRAEAEIIRDKILNGTDSGGIGIMLGALGDAWIAGVDLDRCCRSLRERSSRGLKRSSIDWRPIERFRHLEPASKLSS